MSKTKVKTRPARKTARVTTNKSAPKKEGILTKLFDFKCDQILEVAAKLFYERGYRATTVDAIAGELAVTKPFIYYHFKNKEDILEHLFKRTMILSLGFSSEVDVDNGVPTETLRHLIVQFVKGVIETRYSTGVFWRGEKDLPTLDKERGREFRRNFEAPFLKLLNRGIETGEFRVRDIRLTLTCTEGMINWIYTWYQPEGRLAPDELAELISELVLNMVRAEGKTESKARLRVSATPHKRSL